MAKQKKSQTTISPLNSSVDKAATIKKKAVTKTKKKDETPRRGDMTTEKLAEEAALTALLFGGGTSSDVNVDMDVNRSSRDKSQDVDTNQIPDEMLFTIDRSGVEVDEEGVAGGAWQDDDEDASEEESESSGEEEQQAVSMAVAAWQDEDEDSDDEDESKNKVSLVGGANRIKKLRRYRDEKDPISMKEYELRLRERFVNTASVAARTDWADVANATEEGDRKKMKISDSDDSDQSDEEDEQYSSVNRILQSNASLFATSSSSLPLPPTILDIYRAKDGNIADPSKSCVNALQFHPTAGKDYDGSKESSDRPLLMTAGMDKMLRFFRIDGETNEKVHGLHFDEMPIMCASFLGNTGSVVMSGRRPFFYVYDAASGNVERYHVKDFGSRERSLENFTVSPDGRVIAFIGNDGYIILLDGMSRRWIGDLKMNGSVRAITFSSDGEYIMGSGSDGDVYKWHVKSRRCVERFHNEDGTITSSLAVSKDMLAVGAESGVVNLYDDRRSTSFSRSASQMERTPIKSVMNLSTSADLVKFNGDGQILAMSTRREKNGLKLLHVPTATVFSNWPTSKTPLKYVWSLDFSPGSKYLCAGTDHGQCLLYQLKHFWND
jgi:U3 small nucleolar RNA-associated protein 18